MKKLNYCIFPVAIALASTAAQAASLEEVIVTAQKRSQSINDVGMSVSAATGETLENAGVFDTGDLIKVSPGLVYTTSQNGTPLFSLRGIGFNDYTLGASPAVSVYVDEVPLSYGAFTKGATLDLERVEVLKGPQGLLFGQNSTGGAINYIPAKPGRDFEAGVRASYGRFGRFESDAFVSGPVSETIAMRAAIPAVQSDEWQKSHTSSDELGKEDLFKGRLQLQWDASDRASVLLGVNGWADKSDTHAGQLQGLMLQVTDPSTAALADEPETQRRIDVFNTLPNSPQNARNADWDRDRDLDRDDRFIQATLRVNYDVTENISFTSITAVSEFEEDYSMDRDGTTLQNAGINSLGSVDTFTQEFRLSGSNDRMQWLLGLNYASNDVSSDENILTGDSTNTAILPDGPWIASSVSSITQDIVDTGIFANLEYDLSDNFTLLAGARYAESKNDYTACMHEGDAGMRATFPFFADVLRGEAPGSTTIAADEDPCLSLEANTFELSRDAYEDSLNEDNVSWRVGLNYQADDDLLVYSLVSKGFKTGSFPLLPASTEAQFEPVTQESVEAWEAGFKWSFPDQSMQLNAAAFYYFYDDKQVRGIIKDPIFNQLDRLVNIPESEVRGIELDWTVAPLDGLLIRVAATYVDSEVKEWYSFNNATTGMQEPGINGVREQGDFSGSALPFTPERHLVADVDYRWPITRDLGAFVGGNLLYSSEANSTFGDPQETRIDSYATLDLRGGIESLDGRWTATAWGRNVTDEYYWTNQFVTQDVIVRYAAKPVVYGVSVKYNFF